MRGKTHRKKCSEVLSFDNLGRVTVCIFDTLQLGKDRLGQLQLDLLLVFTQSRKPESLERKRRRMDRLPLSVARCLKHGLHVGPRLIAEGDRVVLERILGELLARDYRLFWLSPARLKSCRLPGKLETSRLLIVAKRHVIRMRERLMSSVGSHAAAHDRSKRLSSGGGRFGSLFRPRIHQLLHGKPGQLAPGEIVGRDRDFGSDVVRLHVFSVLFLLAGRSFLGLLFFGNPFQEHCLQSMFAGVLLRLSLGKSFSGKLFLVHLEMDSVDARLVGGHLVNLVDNVRVHLVQDHDGRFGLDHPLDARILAESAQLRIRLSQLPFGFWFFTIRVSCHRGCLSGTRTKRLFHLCRLLLLLLLCVAAILLLLLSHNTKPLFDGSVLRSSCLSRVHFRQEI
uniref:Uncharacterized protein n=1 Tax=Cacopsylla melanoneura TaxID=428564 RepID=A0A8D9EXV0_9HEMI